MPEGHTLRRLANDLSAAFAGGPVRVSSPQGRFAADAALVDGQPVLGVISAGKHLFIEFPGDRFIHVHLGLIGKFDVRPGPAEPPVGQVRLRLQNERGYADLRGATACELVTGEQRTAVLGAPRARPTRPGRRPLPRVGPDPPQQAADRRPAARSGGVRRCRQRLPGRGPVPAPDPPAAAGADAAGRAVPRDVGGPRRADARGRAAPGTSTRCARSTRRRRWAGRRGSTSTGERSTSTVVRDSRASCAAPRCAPRYSWDETCSGVRVASPRSARAP